MSIIVRSIVYISMAVTLTAQIPTAQIPIGSLTPEQSRFFWFTLRSIGATDHPPALRAASEHAIAARCALTPAQAAALHSIAVEFNGNLSALEAKKKAAMAGGGPPDASGTGALLMQRDRLIQNEVARMSAVLGSAAIAKMMEPLATAPKP